MSTEKKIAELFRKEKDDRVSSVAADILRSLVILHGSAWRSDLWDTLTDLWRIKEIDLKGMISREKLVSKALVQLNVLGLVESERRLRSDLSRQEPVEDELHVLKDLKISIKVFAFDSLVARYRSEIMGYGCMSS